MIRRLVGWDSALNAARITQNKEITGKEPSDEFKRNIIRARHKIIEVVRYEIITQMQRKTYFHARAHRSPLAFIGSRRQDLQELPYNLDEIQTIYLNVSAEDLLHLASQRLCGKSAIETTEAMIRITQEVAEIEPLLAERMVSQCVVKGFCPEQTPCKYITTVAYKEARERYITR